jgi:hypothetical protein
VKWKGYSHSLRSDTRMVGYWNFEEQGEGDRVWNRAAGNPMTFSREDIEPRDFDGKVSGNAQWVQGRWKGKGAMEFQGVGSGQYLTVGEHRVFRMAGPERSYSAGGWFLVDEFDPQWQNFFSKGDNSWRLHRHTTSNNMTVGLGGQGVPTVGGSDDQGSVNINDGKWHFMFFTFQQKTVVLGNQGASTHHYRMVIDDKIDNDADSTGYLEEPATKYSVNVAFNSQTNPREWDGPIDEVMFFHDVVDPSQVTDMYRVGAVRNRQ